MDRLALVKRTCVEAGITKTVSTTVAQTNELGRIVSWVDSAYEDIQNKYDNWEFLRNDFDFVTISGTSVYTEASITAALAPTISTFLDYNNLKKDSLRIYLTATGVNDEQWLGFVPWDEFRDTRLMGANRAVTGRPIEFSLEPDKSIYLWPVPDDIYTITGEYFKNPGVMTADDDDPLLPGKFHMAIVWKALMSYGAYESATEAYRVGMKEYSRIMFKLESDQLPTIGGFDTLA